MYEVGKVYIWQHQVGQFAYLNGTECTVTGPRVAFWSSITNSTARGWPVDTKVFEGEQTYADVGDLRPRDTPSGEQRVLDQFRQLNMPQVDVGGWNMPVRA